MPSKASFPRRVKTQGAQDSHGDVKYSAGRNIVNNIVITIVAARWVLELSGERSVKYRDV